MTTREICINYINSQRELLNQFENDILNATENDADVAETLYDKDKLNKEIIFYCKSLKEAADILKMAKSKILEYGMVKLSDILIGIYNINIEYISGAEDSICWNSGDKFHVKLKRGRYEMHLPNYIQCVKQGVLYED